MLGYTDLNHGKINGTVQNQFPFLGVLEKNEIAKGIVSCGRDIFIPESELQLRHSHKKAKAGEILGISGT